MGRLTRMIELAKFLYLQRVTGFEVDDVAMLDDEAGRWFTDRIGQCASYLEFGAGGTTRLAARLQVPTISVESDRYFAAAVRKGLAPGHTVTLIDADIGLTTNWGIPVPGTPNTRRVKRWRRYVDLPFATLERIGQPFPDLVLVDGRFRRACALQVAYKAARARAQCDLLFDDYYREERTHYSAIESFLGEPEPLGRAGLFRISPDRQVCETDIAEAMRDFR
ncbi:hypothetical protein [Altererythrobacter sp.]|uniref:hypothetical protein n=1 Tax=Altererythrobacter sp. TaxID=1872480 RepID=UPI003D0ED0B6